MIEPTRYKVEEAVRALVATGSDIPRPCVIMGQDNAPLPDLPYATVTLINDLSEGYTWTRDTPIENRPYQDTHSVYYDPSRSDGPTIDQKASQSAEISFSVQWFSKVVTNPDDPDFQDHIAAADYAKRFQVWAASPSGASEFARRGLTFYRTGTIRNLADITDDPRYGDWEQRRGLDLFIGVIFTDTRDVGVLQSVDIDLYPDEFADRTPPENRVRARIRHDEEP